jgi:hypothetical protein
MFKFQVYNYQKISSLENGRCSTPDVRWYPMNVCYRCLFAVNFCPWIKAVARRFSDVCAYEDFRCTYVAVVSCLMNVVFIVGE